MCRKYFFCQKTIEKHILSVYNLCKVNFVCQQNKVNFVYQQNKVNFVFNIGVIFNTLWVSPSLAENIDKKKQIGDCYETSI